MTEQDRADQIEEDAEGHGRRGLNWSEAEQAEGDDVEGHANKQAARADAEQAEGDDDVEGHNWRGVNKP